MPYENVNHFFNEDLLNFLTFFHKSKKNSFKDELMNRSTNQELQNNQNCLNNIGLE